MCVMILKGRLGMLNLKLKLLESFKSVLPITTIVLILSFFLNFSFYDIIAFVIAAILLIIGMGLFTYGADLSMIAIGEKIGKRLIKTKKVFLILIITFIIGIVITIAEPDLQVLASLMPAIPKHVLIITIGIGVGAFLLISSLRTLYNFNLSKMLVIFYIILFLFLFLSPNEFIPVAFDSGGVTTGPISVPFIIALGVGLSCKRNNKKDKEDSLGLIALCSIGPIITVLILGFFFDTSSDYTMNVANDYNAITDVFLTLGNHLRSHFKEVIFSLVPIIALFIIFGFVTHDIKKKQRKQTITGVILTLIGLTIFFAGVNFGFLPIGYEMGSQLASTSYPYILIPIGMIMGYFTVLAEPALQVLTEQIEELTGGSISRKTMNLCLSIGVALAIGLSLLRAITGLPILYILVPGYIISIILTFLAPKIFTAIAFDSGGAVSGPMTSTFLLPLAIGSCIASGGNILTDAFGIIATVAMTPLIMIQLLGIIYKYKDGHKRIKRVIDETIIEYDWSEK